MLIAAPTNQTPHVGIHPLRNPTQSKPALTVIEAAPGGGQYTVGAPAEMADTPAGRAGQAVTRRAAPRPA
ncbi:AzlD family protein, partial [Stenotrophomonas maltophilia]